MTNHLVGIHFLHRLLGVLATAVVVGMAWGLVKQRAPGYVRRTALLAAVLVVAQFTLGVVSVFTVLAVVPVSLHTLGAAGLIAVLALLATWGRMHPAETPIRAGSTPPAVEV